MTGLKRVKLMVHPGAKYQRAVDNCQDATMNLLSVIILLYRAIFVAGQLAEDGRLVYFIAFHYFSPILCSGFPPPLSCFPLLLPSLSCSSVLPFFHFHSFTLLFSLRSPLHTLPLPSLFLLGPYALSPATRFRCR